jgi:hypothetical protein
MAKLEKGSGLMQKTAYADFCIRPDPFAEIAEWRNGEIEKLNGIGLFALSPFCNSAIEKWSLQ